METQWLMHASRWRYGFNGPIKDNYSVIGSIVGAFSRVGNNIKIFFKKDNKIYLEAANSTYEPIVLDFDQVEIQGNYFLFGEKFNFLRCFINQILIFYHYKSKL